MLFPARLVLFEVKIRMDERLMVATFPMNGRGTAAGCPVSSPACTYCVNATRPAPALDRPAQACYTIGSG